MGSTGYQATSGDLRVLSEMTSSQIAKDAPSSTVGLAGAKGTLTLSNRPRVRNVRIGAIGLGERGGGCKGSLGKWGGGDRGWGKAPNGNAEVKTGRRKK